MVYAKKRKPKQPPEAEALNQREEEIVGVVDRGVNAVVQQWKPIVAVLGAATVILGAVSLYNALQTREEDRAAASLYDAELELPDPGGFAFAGADVDDPAEREADLRAALSQFQAVIDEHGNTVQADIARLEAGHVQSDLGEFGEAEQLYAAAADSKSSMIAMLALGAQATALESLDRPADAAEVLRRQVALTEGATQEFAYLDLIRLQEVAGDTDGALATCREFETALPDSPRIDEVRARIRALGGEPAETGDAGAAAAEVETS